MRCSGWVAEENLWLPRENKKRNTFHRACCSCNHLSFFSKRNRLQRAFNVVADVEKLGFVLGAEERLLALAKNYQFTSPPLGLSDPPPLGARAPPRNTSTRPLGSPRTTSLRAHLQRLCRVTDLHGCYQDSSLSAVGAAPGDCGPALAQSRCQRGVLQMRIRLGGALNATSAGAGCAKTTQFLAKFRSLFPIN